MSSPWAHRSDVLHLNHGSFGATPQAVRQAQAALRSHIDADRDHFFRRELSDRIDGVRRIAAGYLGAAPDGLALLPNASAGITLALQSMDLHAGDEVLVTDHGYASARLAAEDACARSGALLREVALPLACPDAVVLDRVTAAVTPRTRLVIVDHITSPTATILPVAEIVAALAGVAVLVDAAHVPGHIPADVDAIGAVFWVGNFHKWAFSPLSAAAIVVAETQRAAMRPPTVSIDQDLGYPGSFRRQGTVDPSALLCIPDGIAELERFGGSALVDRNTALVARGCSIVADALHTEVVPHRHAAMALVALPDGVAATAEDARRCAEWAEDELDAELQFVAFGGRGYLRLSAQIYNDEADYAEAAARLARGLRTVTS